MFAGTATSIIFGLARLRPFISATYSSADFTRSRGLNAFSSPIVLTCVGRNYLAGRVGDAVNAILAAVGYNFRRLIAWLTALLWLFPIVSLRPAALGGPDHSSTLRLLQDT
jgi:hypothetical protein